MAEQPMSVDDAAATLNRIIKENKAYDRLQEIIASAREHEAKLAQYKRQHEKLEDDLKRYQAHVAEYAASIETQKTQCKAELTAFEAELRNKRDRIERDYQKHAHELENRKSNALTAAVVAENESKQRIAEVTAAAKQYEENFLKVKRDGDAELDKLNESIKAAKSEIEALRKRLGS